MNYLSKWIDEVSVGAGYNVSNKFKWQHNMISFTSPSVFTAESLGVVVLQKHLGIWSGFPRASFNPLTSESSSVKSLLTSSPFQWALLQLSHRPDIVCQWICMCFELSSSITLITFAKLCIFYKICNFICSHLALCGPVLTTEMDKEWSEKC